MMKAKIFLSLTLILVLCASCAPADQSGLDGTTWFLTTIDDAPLIAGTTASITFKEGQVSGTAGCNHFGASYSVEGDTISIDALFSTEMYCMTPDGLMDQEQAFLEYLGVAQRYQRIEGALIIFASPQGILSFENQQPDTDLPAPTGEGVVDSHQGFVAPAGFYLYQDAVTGVSVQGFITSEY